jgi:diaminopimelate epimerase
MPISLSRLTIFKLTATGNDFLLVDLRPSANMKIWRSQWARKPRSHWVKLWCHRHEGIGADGFVFLLNDDVADFKWDFYNSDGSSAEMCGNAARAVSLFVSTKSKKSKLTFNTRAGLIRANVRSAKLIEVQLSRIGEERWAQGMAWRGARVGYDFVHASVPHVVVPVPSVTEHAQLREFALAIKQLPEFAEDGTNVTFVRQISQEKIHSVTFERGVEDFTLSCGTGAVAAAHWLLRGECDREVDVQVPGGHLQVIWKDGHPILKGPARIIAAMNICR